MDNDSSQVLTISEAAGLLRVPVSSLYKLAQDGKIPAQKVGRHWRFHRQTLLNWIAAGSTSFQENKNSTKSLDFS